MLTRGVTEYPYEREKDPTGPFKLSGPPAFQDIAACAYVALAGADAPSLPAASQSIHFTSYLHLRCRSSSKSACFFPCTSYLKLQLTFFRNSAKMQRDCTSSVDEIIFSIVY